MSRALIDVERHVQQARRYCNGAVRAFGFRPAEFFDVEAPDRRQVAGVALP